MYNIIDRMYTDKDARNELLNGYHNDIILMLKQGFRDMATDHMENLHRLRSKFSLFD